MADSRHEAIVESLVKRGWGRTQALGIAASLQEESAFNPAAYNPEGGGQGAHGLAQWRGDRLKEFERKYGKPLQGSSTEEQLDFLTYEMLQGKEQAAGRALVNAKSAAEAANVVSRQYERHDNEKSHARRVALASSWAGEPVTRLEPVAQEGTVTGTQAVFPWGVVPYAGQDRETSPRAVKRAEQEAAAARTVEEQVAANRRLESDMTRYDPQPLLTQQDVAAAETARKAQVGFSAVLGQSRQDPRDQATLALANYFGREKEVPPGDWTFEANRQAIIKPCGGDDDCISWMQENVTGPESMKRAHAELVVRNDMDKVYADAGPGYSFLGRMAGGALDPASWAAAAFTGGLSKAYQIGKLAQVASKMNIVRDASGAIISKVPVGAANALRGSVVVEGAVGNLAVEAMSDLAGEVKGSGDYIMAATIGGAIGILPALGSTRRALNDLVAQKVNDLHADIVADQVERLGKLRDQHPDWTPEQLAREIENQERVEFERRTKGDGPSDLRPQVVPKDVADEFVADVKGTLGKNEVEPGSVQEKEPTVEVKPKEGDEAPKVDKPGTIAEPPDVQNQKAVDSIRKGDDVQRAVTNEETGDVILFGWNPQNTDMTGANVTVKQVLDGLMKHTKRIPGIKYLAEAFKGAEHVKLKFSVKDGPSNYKAGLVTMNRWESRGDLGDVSGRYGLQKNLDGLSAWGVKTVVHEITHAATVQRLYAWMQYKTVKASPTGKALSTGGDVFDESSLKFSKKERQVLEQFDDLYERFKARVGEMKNVDAGMTHGYAASNVYEFAAQAMMDQHTQYILARMPGKPVVGKPTSAIMEFLTYVKRMLLDTQSAKNEPATAKQIRGYNGLNEGMTLIDGIIGLDTGKWKFSDGTPVLYAPNIPGSTPSTISPNARFNAQERWIKRMYVHAADYLQRNPINTERLGTLTERLGIPSVGLILAKSKNEIANMAASIMGETTTGAAGRTVTAAIRQPQIQAQYLGNFRVDFDNAFKQWRGGQPGNVIVDAIKGDRKREFNRLVFEEIHSRRDVAYKPTAPAEVRAAADAAQAAYQRAGDGQRQAVTLGSDFIPTDSKGYVPQELDGGKLSVADGQDIQLFQDFLVTHFQQAYGWDKAWTQGFVPRYIERARRQAVGGVNITDVSIPGDHTSFVRQALEDMGDPGAANALAALNRTGGLSHTKKRLDVDMLHELRPGLRVADFFNSDVDMLTRRYVRRSSGTVALTEVGVHGYKGVQMLREAMLAAQGKNAATLQEVQAFDTLSAEILGHTPKEATINHFASNARILVGLQKLGGLVFTQAMEGMNVAHHLGAQSAINYVPGVASKIGEVRRLAKGLPSNNPVMWSLDSMHGEIGMEGYKVVAPLDAPDHALGAYVDNPSLISRLLRGGQHFQSGISGYRGLMAAQHRWAAEEITRKALRYIKDGGADGALDDMGFTPELRAIMKAELPHISTWTSSGRLAQLDLTKVTDARIAEAFVSAVHRGTSQIIQGTFAGERAQWMHNDWWQLLAQFRAFGITAAEKQWSRTAMREGYAYAAGVLLFQAGMGMLMHTGRTQFNAIGREDREEYIRKNTTPAALIRGSMNYSSMSGVMGDVIEGTFGLAGGLTGEPEVFGGRAGGASITGAIPVIGSADQAIKTLTGRDKSLYGAMKQLPIAGNLWPIVPALNLTKD